MQQILKYDGQILNKLVIGVKEGLQTMTLDINRILFAYDYPEVLKSFSYTYFIIIEMKMNI